MPYGRLSSRRSELRIMEGEPSEGEASPYLTAERLGSLSDTMFGVAMTLVATTLLPAIQAHKGSVLDLFQEMSGELVTVVLSFGISARYWISQQQRLAIERSLTGRQAWLNLVFLFLVVLVPISTSLPGLAGREAIESSVLIYGAHLSLIATVNLLLWLELRHKPRARDAAKRSAQALAFFLAALAVGAFYPSLAFFLWIGASVTRMPTALLAATVRGGEKQQAPKG
jgi:uncharacterized membrane protein